MPALAGRKARHARCSQAPRWQRGVFHPDLPLLARLDRAAAAAGRTCLSRETDQAPMKSRPGRFCGTQRAARQGTRHGHLLRLGQRKKEPTRWALPLQPGTDAKKAAALQQAIRAPSSPQMPTNCGTRAAQRAPGHPRRYAAWCGRSSAPSSSPAPCREPGPSLLGRKAMLARSESALEQQAFGGRDGGGSCAGVAVELLEDVLDMRGDRPGSDD
jgi:hypothetical protein